MRSVAGIDPGWGVTIIRVMTGLTIAVIGYQKFSWGIPDLATRYAGYRIPLAGLMAPVIAGLQLVGGLLLIAGVATRWLGLLFAGVFAVGAFWVKLRLLGWDAGEVDRMLLAAGLLLFLAGPGKAAVDALWLERER